MTDIKKKFIDIFFEPEEDEEPIAEEETSYETTKDILAAFRKEKEKEKAIEEAKEEELPIINAKDLLYRKPGQSAFINLDDNTKGSNFSFNEKNEYQMSSQISPIFGIIQESKKKRKNTVVKSENKVSKTSESHLDIVTSPIYGYGNREDFSSTKRDKTAQVEELLKEDEDEVFDALSNGKDDSEINLFDLFGDDN